MAELTASRKARKSHSSESVPVLKKLSYNLRLLRMRMTGSNDGRRHAREALDELAAVVADFEAMTGRAARDSTVLEIGFGARPMRAFALSTIFADATAIDMDTPLLGLGDLLPVLRTNGIERSLKSLVRYLMFDRTLWQGFHSELTALHPGYRADRAQLVVGDAGAERTWEKLGQFDLIFSSDVFEHIPEPDLERLMGQIRRHLKPGGLVVVRPMVFTGISGSHEIEWYPHQIDRAPSEKAWSHLLDPGFKTGTYLNKFRRRDFAELFHRAGFVILRDEAMLGRIGEHYLTEGKRRQLAGYDDYELFSNRVEFMLRPE